MQPQLVSLLARGARRGLETLAFWAAVALPLAYLLVALAPVGLDPPVVAALVAAHAVALFVGHRHALDGAVPREEPPDRYRQA